jgi:hypothetical protein
MSRHSVNILVMTVDAKSVHVATVTCIAMVGVMATDINSSRCNRSLGSSFPVYVSCSIFLHETVRFTNAFIISD